MKRGTNMIGVGLGMALGAAGVLVYQSVVKDLKKADENSASKPSIEEYVIQTRADAEGTLANLRSLSYKYKNVSIADYYDLIGVSTVYTDNDYGWTTELLSKAKIVQVLGGFEIKLPVAVKLAQ